MKLTFLKPRGRDSKGSYYVIDPATGLHLMGWYWSKGHKQPKEIVVVKQSNIRRTTLTFFHEFTHYLTDLLIKNPERKERLYRLFDDWSFRHRF